jgi:hypothetical protein
LNKKDEDVVAYYIYPSKFNNESEHHKEEQILYKDRKNYLKTIDEGENLCVIYLTKLWLNNFLFDKNKPPSGILQKVNYKLIF